LESFIEWRERMTRNWIGGKKGEQKDLGIQVKNGGTREENNNKCVHAYRLAGRLRCASAPAKWPCHRKTMATPKTATAMIPQACGSKDRQGKGPMATHAHGMLCHSHRCTRIPTRRPHGAFETTSTHRSSTPTQTYIMRIWCTARSKARCLWVWG
jgi:hypothetical protein